jgi:hypothetical protein
VKFREGFYGLIGMVLEDTAMVLEDSESVMDGHVRNCIVNLHRGNLPAINFLGRLAAGVARGRLG